MSSALDKLTIKGFKSIKSLEDFELGKLNVMIGGNGAGKSNLVDMFRMLRAMVDEDFANFVTDRGGADDFLFNGPKQTKVIEAEFRFGRNSYSFQLKPTASECFSIRVEKERYLEHSWTTIGRGKRESKITANRNEKSTVYPGSPGVGYYIHDAISNWVVYHFHDTSAEAPMRRSEITADNIRLRPDASNIAPFLLELREDEPKRYEEVVGAIRLVTPFFNDDGTIRFVCLATALLQPDPPSTIVIDEPELGLHPYAIEILAELIQAASERTQVIVSTQSSPLIDNFEPEDIIVVSRENGASAFKRLDAKELSHWLDDYSLGDLWRKNILAGGPVHE